MWSVQRAGVRSHLGPTSARCFGRDPSAPRGWEPRGPVRPQPGAAVEIRAAWGSGWGTMGRFRCSRWSGSRGAMLAYCPNPDAGFQKTWIALPTRARPLRTDTRRVCFRPLTRRPFHGSDGRARRPPSATGAATGGRHASTTELLVIPGTNGVRTLTGFVALFPFRELRGVLHRPSVMDPRGHLSCRARPGLCRPSTVEFSDKPGAVGRGEHRSALSTYTT
jgi:hypothetical protein